MSVEVWLAFSAATALLLVIPGPTVLLFVSYALGQGRRSVIPMVVGASLGDLTAMTLSMIGVGALLATSATLFTALKWAGAAYLVYLGAKLWRAGGALSAPARPDQNSGVRVLAHAWLVTVLNPKSITFFVAFFPQFLDPAADFLTQMLVFEATFLALAVLNAFAYAMAAAKARDVFRSPGAMRLFNRAGGSLLIGAGIATVSLRSSQP